MKKIIGYVLAAVMLSTLLSACYSRSCEQPAPVSYKDEMRR